MRVGQGYDLHRLVSGRALVLGGVRIPHDRGLAGHSDADVLAHAVGDALLGALGEGDLGTHFPSADERWRDASGATLLTEITRLVARAGFRIENVDATVIAAEPRLAPYRTQIAAGLAAQLGSEAKRVNVKLKSTDGLGTIGRGEGIAAQAIVLLERSEA
jgi:2-C-methyl-D-erythritol 2,4-cyclodiphosphate synthase